MPPAARISDNHVCPMANPDGSPHTGGVIMPPGIPTVIIGGQPAATVGSMCVCVGPPDSITKGSKSVIFNGRPAARQGDSTAHQGTIAAGFLSVILGD